ncbi:MAG: tRNA (adenosine(37)-N6)-dimethylallyltransferase MiaA [Thermoleophilia bacterium]
MARPPLVALFGATALGKSEVATRLAEELDAEIVVADSMQVYAGLAIVTNQPSLQEQARIAHHMVGFVAPQREYTVAEYARAAHAVIDDLLARGRAVVVEGGSGLYLRAALGDLAFAAAADLEERAELERRWASEPEDLVAELRRLDPDAAARVDLANPRRVIRALEAAHAGGSGRRVLGRDQLWLPGERYDHLLMVLDPDQDRDALSQRIDARVDWMVAQGAAEEVAAARWGGPFSRTARQAIGVRELLAYVDGETSLAAAAATMKSRTRALVRRQLTWMRKLPNATRLTTGAGLEATAREALRLVEGRAW